MPILKLNHLRTVEAMRNSAHRGPILKLVGRINQIAPVCKIGNN